MPAAVVGKDYFWKKSGALTYGRTEPVKQMASKDMRAIEDCNASALPSTVSAVRPRVPRLGGLLPPRF